MKLRVEGDERVIRTLTSAELIAEPVTEALRVIARDGQQVAQRGAPGSVGRTLQSEVRGFSAQVYSTHPAALPIEVGRRRGAPLPPLGAIARWAASRGITVEPFVLARSIAQRGIKGRFFLQAAREHIESRANRYLVDLGADIERRWHA